MSIISEALKKASHSTKNKRVELEHREVRRPKVKRWKRASLALLILFGFSAGLIFYFLAPPPSEEVVSSQREEIEEEIVMDAYSPPALVQDLKVVTPAEEVDKVINLNGIMYTPKRPLAVINNEILAEGDTIGKFKIIKIGKSFVKVASEDQEFTVRLKP